MITIFIQCDDEPVPIILQYPYMFISGVQGVSKCFALALRCLAEASKNRLSSEEVLHSLEQIYAKPSQVILSNIPGFLFFSFFIKKPRNENLQKPPLKDLHFIIVIKRLRNCISLSSRHQWKLRFAGLVGSCVHIRDRNLVEMDSAKHSSNKSRWARTFAKVMHIQAVTGLDKFQKSKPKMWEKVKPDRTVDENHQRVFFGEEDEKLQKRAVMDAFIAKLFAAISSVKAAYAELQVYHLPYDADGIQSADQILVSELQSLSELKQSFLKKHFDDISPETTQQSAEVQEQKNLIKTYEITRKKLDSQSKLKESELIFLKEKLEEIRRENKIIEKRLNSSGSLSSSSSSSHVKLSFSSLSPTNFLFVLKQTTKSIRSLVKFMISEMESANWDLDAAANSIHPDVVYWDSTHICYAFESFVCKHMFDGFNLPEFSILEDSQSKEKPREFFFDKFMELKSLKAREYITWKPASTFAEFCRCKYLKLVHPKMEASLFGNLSQRNLVNARKFPETAFFDSFLEVAKWVWLLHCLAFSFNPDGATIFQVPKGSRFSEVFMDSVNEEAFLSPESSPEVAFMVVPGFQVGKTVIQCQVYLV
ncbi:hypothetical protein QVD17_14235 [Tagetes erecta]|uniref:DUF641 domain-containing protein n=1 Tax=Tagetes erecta TaxID=13708 RepID=A0AAD8L1F5_TARER|nr:hypothetical protein QVD17_14235 [Tagetes erecta]